MIGCQKEESISFEESLSLVANVRAWYESKHDSKLTENASFYGAPDWGKATIHEGSLYIPLRTKTNVEMKDYNLKKMTYATSYLVVTEKESKNFEEKLTVMIAPDFGSSKGNALNSSYFLYYDSDNSLSEFLLPQDKLIRRPLNSNTTARGGGCETIGIYLNITYTDGTTEKILLATYDECEGDEDIGSNGTGSPVEEPDEDFIVVPSCKSFEYANNGLVKGCGVSNITNIFAAYGVNPDGTTYEHEVWLEITRGYFTMSPGWTNGSAANQTAVALRAANLATKAWFLLNPRATSIALGQEWDRNIKRTMNLIGGSFSKTPPFQIRSIAPYVEEFAWTATDCS